MKRQLALTGLLLAVCALGGAQQNSGNRVVIPARNATSSRVIEVSLVHASVTVKTHSGKEVIAELAGASASPSTRVVDGMHRIDAGTDSGIEVREIDNVIRLGVSMRAGHQRNLILTVPVEASLNLKTVQGNIDVEGVHGEIDVSATQGNVTLSQISGTVLASSTQGNLRVSMDRVDPAKPLSFSSLNGNIDVTLPADLKANLKFKSLRGEIWSDFDVVTSGATRVDGMHSLTGGGAYGAGMDRQIVGTINGGGVEASFRTLNGKISIHKKK